jgi:hypothetical protein
VGATRAVVAGRARAGGGGAQPLSSVVFSTPPMSHVMMVSSAEMTVP